MLIRDWDILRYIHPPHAPHAASSNDHCLDQWTFKPRHIIYHIYIFAIRTSRKGTVTKYSWEALHKWPCSPFRRRRRKPFRQLSDAEVSFPYFCHSWFQCIVKDHLKYLFLTESRSGNEDDETGRCSMMLEGISKTEICLPSDIFDIKSQVEMWSGGCHRISQGHKFN